MTSQAVAPAAEPREEPLVEKVRKAIDRHGAPWHVTQLGCRAEYRFQPSPARNGTEAHDASDPLLDGP